MKKTLKIIIESLCIIALLFSTVSTALYWLEYPKHENTKYIVYEEMTKLQYDAIKFELVNAVDSYIQVTGKNSRLNGISVVNSCIKHDIDICFVLAQGQQESHFGTTGLARKTNGVWNVFAYTGIEYNNIPENGKFKTPDESIEPYLSLLDERYLVGGKTEYDMMKNFVDKHGKRYAKSTTYESSITTTYQYIKANTKIDSLSQELKYYGAILGY